MADRRTALDKHLGLSEEDSRHSSYRRQALVNHVGEALDAQNYAAAQVYALLLIGEKLESMPSSITVSNTEELATGIGVSLGPDLRAIADNIGAIG